MLWGCSYNWNVDVDGYNLFRKNRQGKKKKGVGLCMKDRYTFSEVLDKVVSRPGHHREL